MKQRWVPVLVVLSALVAWLLWPVPVEPLEAGEPSVQSSEGSEERRSRSRARALWHQLGTVELELLVVDRDFQPLSGVEVRVFGEEQVSDTQGRVRFEELSRGKVPSIGVDPPWSVVSMSSTPLYASETWTLVLEPICPGEVLLLGADGQPLPGVSVMFGGSGETDEQGRVWFEERPCGRAEITVDWRIRRMVEVYGEEELVVQLEGPHHGEIQLVDPYGEAVDLELGSRISGLTELERLGPGHYALTSLLRRVGVKWEGGGRRVLLDGSLVTVVVHPLREVGVEVLGLDPEVLKCDGQPCEREGADWLCSCRHGLLSILWIEEPRHSRRIRLDEHQVTWDLRTSLVRGRWTGPLPCGVSAMNQLIETRAGDCGAGGEFELELSPGLWTIGVGYGESLGGSVEVLVEDQDLDVGEIGEGSGSLVGHIEADFPLDGGSIWALPQGLAELRPDGSVEVRGMGEGQAWLILNAGEYGQFQHIVHAEDESFVWTVRADQCDPWGACDPPESLLQDTGPADTGWQDSGEG